MQKNSDSHWFCRHVLVYVEDLDTCVAVWCLEDSPAVLSKGNSCVESGYTGRWQPGEASNLIKGGKSCIERTTMIQWSFQVFPRPNPMRKETREPFTQRIIESTFDLFNSSNTVDTNIRCTSSILGKRKLSNKPECKHNFFRSSRRTVWQTKITRASCKRRSAYNHRGETFGCIVTVVHEIMNVENEHRVQHHY